LAIPSTPAPRAEERPAVVDDADRVDHQHRQPLVADDGLQGGAELLGLRGRGGLVQLGAGRGLEPVVPDEVRVLDTASSGTLVKSWVLTFQTGSHGRSAMLSNGPPGAMESDERIVRTLPSSPGGVR
jgi:hypothetical protein